jgi:hypothetical protein
VKEGKIKTRERGCKIRYPSGEKVPIEFKVEVEVQIGKYSEEIPMFVAEISDDCLLGVDFLKKINLEGIFEFAFGSTNKEKKVQSCSRIKVSPEKVPSPEKDRSILKELFENNSANLDKAQKDIFAHFLGEFQGVFSGNIVAGNCDIVEHVINVKDSLPIKQVPRRIPIQMREEVYKIIEEMREQGVIEESQSP